MAGVDLVLSRDSHNRRSTNKCATAMRRFTSDTREEDISFPRRGWITGISDTIQYLVLSSLNSGTDGVGEQSPTTRL
jgi:hypothetical protein